MRATAVSILGDVVFSKTARERLASFHRDTDTRFCSRIVIVFEGSPIGSTA